MSEQPIESPQFVTCHCEHCGGGIEFDANQFDPAENTIVSCPHCELKTTIFVPEQKIPPVISDESLHPRQISEERREEKQFPRTPANLTRIDEDEALIEVCIEVIHSEQIASVSLLQRRLKLGYIRAARIMDELERRGIIGPSKGAEPRKILIDLNSEKNFHNAKTTEAQHQNDLDAAYFRQNNFSERLTPNQLSDFIGQNKIKARLELAIAAAKHRGESLNHILLIGSPGSGKATLASVIAKVMGANIKITSGTTVTKCSDLAGLLTNLEEGDVLFIEEIHRLPRIIEEYLHPAAKDFQLDIIIDSGPNARKVRLNLPRFTLIGSTTTKERLTPNLLSSFRIIENMDGYSLEEMAVMVRRFATAFEVEIDADATDRIARTADGTPIDVLNRLQHVRDFAHVKGNEKITLEIAEAALKMLASSDEKPVVSESRDAIPSAVRREVWRRDEGKCKKCGSRKNLEYDHIIPVAEGGSNTARNIELLCQDCNRAKSDLIQ